MATDIAGHDMALTPVPGAWLAAELASTPEEWRVPLPAAVVDDLLRAAERSGGVTDDPFQPCPDVSDETMSLVASVHRMLAGRPGFAVVTGFPVDERPELTEAAYWIFGLLLGRPTRQNLRGDMIVRVENSGRVATERGGQLYRLPVALPFHVDVSTDVIGLLCVRPSQEGGLSRVISSETLHNMMLADYPDLLPVLYQPLPFKVPPLATPDGQDAPAWCEIPVFSRLGGHFASFYMRKFVEQAQEFADAPRLTARQSAALAAADEVLARPELPLDMQLHAGDLQLVNNLRVLHSRTAYHDDDPARGRLLLRLHLAFAGSSTLPEEYSPLFGSVAPGVYRGGSWRLDEAVHMFGANLEAAGSATGR